MKPIEDVREISALTYGFIASKALFAAVELDLFTKIAGGADTLSTIAEATGVAANRARTLLTTLKTVGLITEQDDRFGNAPATAAYLVAGAPGDFREYIRVVNGRFLYEGLRHLDKSMRGEQVFHDKGFYEGIVYSEGGVGGPAFSSAQHSGSLGPARLMARRVDLAGATKFLDVGGGSGAYTLAFLKQNPKLRATILDFPETIQTAQRYASEAGCERSCGPCRGKCHHDDVARRAGCRADVLCLERRWRQRHTDACTPRLHGTASGRTSAGPRFHGR